LERAAIERLERGLALCVERSDGGSRLLLEAILRGEEGHADWLEGQLELLRQLSCAANPLTALPLKLLNGGPQNPGTTGGSSLMFGPHRLPA
jgi:hypothetical protein